MSLREFFAGLASQARHDNEFLWALRFQPPSWNLLFTKIDCHPGEGQDLLIYKRQLYSQDAKTRTFTWIFYLLSKFIFQ